MNRGFPSNCGCGARITKFTSSTQENPGRLSFVVKPEERITYSNGWKKRYLKSLKMHCLKLKSMRLRLVK
ncbi:unnamed protein product [Brassica rapa subsp. trilocularis]